MNSEKQNWLHAIIIWALIAAVTLLIVITQCNCTTPETVKRSAPTAVLAIQESIATVGDNQSAVTKPLKDAIMLLRPVIEFLGVPADVVFYDSSTDMAEVLARQTEIDVRQQKMLKDMMTNFAEKILPKQLSAFLPGKSDGEPFDQNGLILKIVGLIAGLYASWKGTGAVVKKIKKNKEANPAL